MIKLRLAERLPSVKGGWAALASATHNAARARV